jgi:hypothetical protein
MKEMTAEDWHDVQHLAERIQYPPERITLLRRRLEANTPRHGAPLVLLAGRPKSGLELLLSRRLAPQIAAEVEKTTRPLVVGRTPDVVRPAIGSWATCKASRPGTGHFIVLRSAGEPPADTLAQIASLGYVDHAVLVTRLGQPLHIHERALAQSLAALVATVRVVVVGLPGEEATAAELAEVSAYAASQMRQAGFDDGRFLGAGIWFTDDQPHAGAITNVEDFLSIGATEASVGHSGMTQHALSALFADMRRHAAAAPTPAVTAAALPEDEQNRLVQELRTYLADLGREVERQQQAHCLTDTDGLRRYIIDAVRGWGAYTGVEGHWLKYVERVKPGTQAALIAETGAAASLLDCAAAHSKPGGHEAHRTSAPTSDGPYAVFAKRAALVCGCGGLALLLSMLFVSPAGVPVMTFVGGAASVGGALLGYAVAGRIFPTPRSTAAVAAPGGHGTTTPIAVHSWTQFERHLTTWFSDRIREQYGSPMDEWRALAQKLHLEGV